MQKNEFVKGKWYIPIDYPTWPYQFICWDNNGNMTANYKSGSHGTYKRIAPISNNQFWVNCREAVPSEYEHLIPEEYREKIENYAIF